MELSSAAFMPDEIAYPLEGRRGGSLNGLKVAVKDVFDIANTRTSGGSPAWRDSQLPATRNSGAVDRLLQAGADVVGKTVCDEFCYSTVGANAHFGTPCNANAPMRIPGGSSSGSASAVASGACDIALGTDTGGSVRVPAALCGVYGIRVSSARFDLDGCMEMAPSFDAGGWLAADLQAFQEVGSKLLINPPSPGRVENIVALQDAFDIADDRISEHLAALLSTRSLDLAVSWDCFSDETLDHWREAMRVVQAFEVWQTFGAFICANNPVFGPGVDERMRVASQVSALEAARAREILLEVRQRMEYLVCPGTILALPTVPTIAPLRSASPATLEDYRVRGMRLSCLASISGLPQVTIPAGTVEGAPIALSFIGWHGSDEVLLNVAGVVGRVIAVDTFELPINEGRPFKGGDK